MRLAKFQFLEIEIETRKINMLKINDLSAERLKDSRQALKNFKLEAVTMCHIDRIRCQNRKQ